MQSFSTPFANTMEIKGSKLIKVTIEFISNTETRILLNINRQLHLRRGDTIRYSRLVLGYTGAETGVAPLQRAHQIDLGFPCLQHADHHGLIVAHAGELVPHLA